MDLAFVGGIAFLGLVVGSFLNVVASRVPAGQSIVRPASRCPSCQHDILHRDNLPVVSWLLLRGRCRHCRKPINLRYPLVEGGTALVFALVGWQFGLAWQTPAFLVLVAASVALSVTDVEQHVLPPAILLISSTAITVVLALAAAIEAQWSELALAAVGAVSTLILLQAAAVLGPGHADTRIKRLGPLLGAPLGFVGLDALAVGTVALTLVLAANTTLLFARRRRHNDGVLPITPVLATTTLVVILVFAGA